ncbi:NADH dehydrogenase 1 alpha subcomplex subunit 6 ndufa6 [Cichlidogyrus casuarinus]|uniref:NADH dehydrogenase [ubiquinone] 1 alpha subcomplex subunit 6 n=1 Tax=Cichlidogyrus casuarinus TaxID=1844966 RepID=A0ABD2QF66_9PLAT
MRVINLYRAWYRQVPYIVKEYAQSNMELSERELKSKLREEFYKHKNLTDLRLIDLVVHRGQNELIETAHLWKSDTHIMEYFQDTRTPKKSSYIEKFIDGHQD